MRFIITAMLVCIAIAGCAPVTETPSVITVSVDGHGEFDYGEHLNPRRLANQAAFKARVRQDQRMTEGKPFTVEANVAEYLDLVQSVGGCKGCPPRGLPGVRNRLRSDVLDGLAHASLG